MQKVKVRETIEVSKLNCKGKLISLHRLQVSFPIPEDKITDRLCLESPLIIYF